MNNIFLSHDFIFDHTTTKITNQKQSTGKAVFFLFARKYFVLSCSKADAALSFECQMTTN